MNTPELHPYLFLMVLLGMAMAFPLIPLALARLWALRFGAPRPGPQKNSTYECGIETRGDPLVQFRSGYYLYGILFLIFDVEAVFLFPFAVSFLGLSFGAVIAMLVFVLLLAEGLAWAWLKGLLDWK